MPARNGSVPAVPTVQPNRSVEALVTNLDGVPVVVLAELLQVDQVTGLVR
jgi:hypothetical protein